MILMSRFRRPQGLTILPMLLVLLWAVGCARPDGLQTDNGAAHAEQHQVPFHDGDVAPDAHPNDSSATPGTALNPDPNLPFHDSQNLPAGTLLTVRLKNPISAENPAAEETFEAVVDEPIEIDGNKLVPRGAPVAGRVESARASNVRRDRGYVRLALNAIDLAGASLPIQTSSLFVRGNAGDTQVSQVKDPQNGASFAVVRIEKGRRLTFRLTQPVYVAAPQRTLAGH
jgi:hypothetical protein